MTDDRDETPIPQSLLSAMSCQPSLEDLYRYMDGFVDGERKATIESHLNACGGCGELYHFHAVLRDLVGRTCQVDLPDGLRRRVVDAINDLR